ncbi:MAG: hypothetical protein COT74_08440 [Bdellovibrionales bacterium CG10_big_fil_rev_8_21_14_0_10_45_34]|nr:MAG: hypothetical protein COT74_08440 [Bdellovibrionales bacterium CG10_big_fil_rev_8_21_14_0_10_45_34]
MLETSSSKDTDQPTIVTFFSKLAPVTVVCIVISGCGQKDDSNPNPQNNPPAPTSNWRDPLSLNHVQSFVVNDAPQMMKEVSDISELRPTSSSRRFCDNQYLKSILVAAGNKTETLNSMTYYSSGFAEELRVEIQITDIGPQDIQAANYQPNQPNMVPFRPRFRMTTTNRNSDPFTPNHRTLHEFNWEPIPLKAILLQESSNPPNNNQSIPGGPHAQAQVPGGDGIQSRYQSHVQYLKSHIPGLEPQKGCRIEKDVTSKDSVMEVIYGEAYFEGVPTAVEQVEIITSYDVVEICPESKETSKTSNKQSASRSEGAVKTSPQAERLQSKRPSPTEGGEVISETNQRGEKVATKVTRTVVDRLTERSVVVKSYDHFSLFAQMVPATAANCAKMPAAVPIFAKFTESYDDAGPFKEMVEIHSGLTHLGVRP